jgi:hypothetical protein
MVVFQARKDRREKKQAAAGVAVDKVGAEVKTTKKKK